MSIFDQGARLVPDIDTEAEERRILMRICNAPWLTDLSRRVQHYGYVAGKLQTRRWKKDGEDSDRFSTEILLIPGGRVQFLDKPNGNGATAPNGEAAPPAASGPAAPADGSDIPF